jgi:hypothetical protein
VVRTSTRLTRPTRHQTVVCRRRIPCSLSLATTNVEWSWQERTSNMPCCEIKSESRWTKKTTTTWAIEFNAIDTLSLQMVFSTCLHPLSLRHIGQIREHFFRTMAASAGSTCPLDISMASPWGPKIWLFQGWRMESYGIPLIQGWSLWKIAKPDEVWPWNGDNWDCNKKNQPWSNFQGTPYWVPGVEHGASSKQFCSMLAQKQLFWSELMEISGSLRS